MTYRGTGRAVHVHCEKPIRRAAQSEGADADGFRLAIGRLQCRRARVSGLSRGEPWS